MSDLRQGREESKRVSCHEEWDYDISRSPAIARLVGLKLSCWHCHAVEHFGRTEILGRSGELLRAVEDTIEHFCRVNGSDATRSPPTVPTPGQNGTV